MKFPIISSDEKRDRRCLQTPIALLHGSPQFSSNIIKIGKIRQFRCSKITFYKKNVEKNNVLSSFATFVNIIEVCKIGIFLLKISTIFLKVLNIYLFLKYFGKLQL